MAEGFVMSRRLAEAVKKVVKQVLSQSPEIRQLRQRRQPVSTGPVRVKTTEAISKGSFGTCEIYRGESSANLSKSNEDTIEVYNPFADVESDKWLTVIPLNGGWEALAAEC